MKTAYIPGFDGFAIKVSPGFFDNPKIGLPSLNGLMILFSAKTGLVEALLLDNGYLTDVRTAAAGAVAARHLAPARGRDGGRARHRRAGAAADRRRRISCGPSRACSSGAAIRRRRSACAADLAAHARHRGARPCADPAALVRRKPARRHHDARRAAGAPGRLAASRPPHHRHGLRPGAARTRSNPPPRPPPTSMSATASSQCELLGELRSAHRRRACGPAHAAGTRRDRHRAQRPAARADDQVTICDLTGTGAQDTAIATFAVAGGAQGRCRVCDLDLSHAEARRPRPQDPVDPRDARAASPRRNSPGG